MDWRVHPQRMSRLPAAPLVGKPPSAENKAASCAASPLRPVRPKELLIWSALAGVLWPPLAAIPVALAAVIPTASPQSAEKAVPASLAEVAASVIQRRSCSNYSCWRLPKTRPASSRAGLAVVTQRGLPRGAAACLAEIPLQL